MNSEEHILLIEPDLGDERIQAAVAELRTMIAERYPDTTFSTFEGDDPEGIYLRAVVDAADLDEVTDLFIDRLVEIQEAGLPVFVALDWSDARVRASLSRPTSDQLPIEQLLPIG